MFTIIIIIIIIIIITIIIIIVIIIPTGKRPLGRPRRRWEDNIRIYLEEIRIGIIGEPL